MIGILVYASSYNIQNIPVGEFREELSSPSKEYTLKSYFIDGGALSGNAMRVELVNNKTKKIKNLYFNYPESEAIMNWIDEETIKINEITLNIFKDTYDWRKKH